METEIKIIPKHITAFRHIATASLQGTCLAKQCCQAVLVVITNFLNLFDCVWDNRQFIVEFYGCIAKVVSSTALFELKEAANKLGFYWKSQLKTRKESNGCLLISKFVELKISSVMESAC